MPDSVVNGRQPKPIVSEGFLQNPYPTYRQFLQEGPLHFIGLGPGFHAAFTYPLVSSLLKDARFSAKRTEALLLNLPPERRPDFAPMAKMLGLWLLFMDPPEHSRLRKLMNKGFSPQVADELRPRLEALADRMLDGIEAEDDVEFVSQFAHPFPAKVIAELMDIPESMHADLISWSETIATMIGNPGRTVAHCETAQTALLALTSYFEILVTQRRRSPGTDLISLLLEIEADGEVLTADELYAQCIMLLFGGHETTRNLITTGLYTLLEYPDRLRQLREDPSTIRTCVEEMLRFQSPVQFVARVAKEDLTLENTSIRKGEAVMLMMGAANRDSDVFRNPDVFDLRRINNVHLAFGAGPHFCLGNQIARLETQTAILKLVQRFPKLGFAAKPPEWAENLALRGFRRFPLQLHV